jgi:vancomycin resistance protein YoaR
MKTVVKVLLPLSLLGSLAVAGGVLTLRAGLLRETPRGVMAGGHVIDGAVPLGVWVDQRREALLGREVSLETGTDSEPFRRVALGELGVEVDVSATMRAIRAEAGSNDLPGALAVSRRAQDGEIDVPLRFRVDEAKARSYLEKLAPLVRREPVNARLDLMGHARISEVPGAELDAPATVERLMSLSHEGGEVLGLATRPVKPAFTLADIASVDVSKIMGSAESSFSLFGTGAGRSVNVANAAKKLDGWVIAPGETFSFNDVVGPRTVEAGFTQAPEIVADELEMGIGGGTCQVASMVHTASMNAALDILERHNHGRPSSYTKLGLDATVAYGKVDLRIKNPFSFPLILHAYLPKPTMVRVEVLGADPVARVSYTYAVNKSDDFFRRITYKPELPAGKMVQHQKGIRGFDVVSHVTTTWNDGRVTDRSYFSGYRPVPEVYWVGQGVDEETLPELPEGAARVEKRGFRRAPASRPVSGDLPRQNNG